MDFFTKCHRVAQICGLCWTKYYTIYCIIKLKIRLMQCVFIIRNMYILHNIYSINMADAGRGAPEKSFFAPPETKFANYLASFNPGQSAG